MLPLDGRYMSRRGDMGFCPRERNMLGQDWLQFVGTINP
jgi:hypothetical protein